MQKRVFSHMRTAKTQISLNIRAIWSGPSLSAKRNIGYVWMESKGPDDTYFVHAQDNLNLCILRVFEGNFRLARPNVKLYFAFAEGTLGGRIK